MNDTKISVQLYADNYDDGNITNSLIQQKFGFEIKFENSFERSKRILSLDQVVQLKRYIELALSSHEEMQRLQVISKQLDDINQIVEKSWKC